jgi:hypothetical protein
MSNPIQIMQKLEQAIQALGQGNIQLKSLGVKKSDAERKYKIALSKELLRLRLDKQPVTIIQDLAKGNELISQLRLERDLSENAYTVCVEAMRNTRIEVETLRSFLTWERTELSNS